MLTYSLGDMLRPLASFNMSAKSRRIQRNSGKNVAKSLPSSSPLVPECTCMCFVRLTISPRFDRAASSMAPVELYLTELVRSSV